MDGGRAHALAAQGRTEAQRAQRSPAVHAMARVGLVARGCVYVVVGVLALLVATGRSNRETDRRGALQVIAGQPFGRALLVLLAAGFAGHALWRLLDAVGGHAGEGGARRALGRVGSLLVGVLYAGFAASCIAYVAGSGGGGSGEQGWTARLLALPYGRALTGIAGAVVLGVAAGIAVWTLRGKYEEGLRHERMGPAVRRLVEALGGAGHGARALVAALLGVFVLRAAVTYDPAQARGLDGALKTLAQGTTGRALILVTAAGLGAHGLFSLLEARYRRV